MIRWPPRPHSIRQKLVLLIWLVAAAALVLVSVALLIYEYTRFRGTSVRDLTTQADIIAAAVVTPLVFDNRKESTKTLAAALEARPDVLWAAVYNKAGQRFAVYRGLSDTGREIPLLAPPPDHRFIGGELEVVQPILSGEDREGILLLHVHLREQRARLINYALILGLLTLVALLGAFALGARLQGVVTDPLFELIQTAESVGFEKNYTVRARKRSDDELGRLVDEFNEMLAQIQHRDEALGASEMRFRQLAEAIDQVFWMMDLVTPKVLYVSPAYERIWGRPAAMLEADPMAWFAAVHPDDRQRVSRSLEVRRQTGVSEAEFRIIRPDGSVRWVRNRAFPVREASGEVRRTAGVVEDITERHRAEEQRDRFFNLSLDLLCMADLNGSFTRVNPAFARTLGFTTEELLRRPFLELALPEDLPVVTAALERLRHGKDVVAFEVRSRCKDGSLRTISWTCPAPAPGTTELFAVGRDVTEAQRARQALQQSEERFRQLAEVVREVFWMTNIEKTEMIYISPGYEQIWGRSCASLYASPRDWLEAIHREDRARVIQAALIKQTAGAYDEEYRIVRPDGTVRWIRDRAFPVRDEKGKAYRLAGIAEDITERRKLEEQIVEISDREQARLAEEIHDSLCQHLVSTGLAATLLEDKLRERTSPEAAEAHEIALLIDAAVAQAYNLVGGLFPARLAEEGLASALQEFLHQLSSRHDIRFVVDYPEPVSVGDAVATHLFRIAQEAVNNAVKHARASSIKVSLFQRNGTVRLVITDDGVGPAPVERQRGKGFGLHFMRYRASLIGGAIELRPGPEHGTVLTCSLRSSA